MSLDSSSLTANAEPAPPESELLVECREDGVAIVRMNRPKATNALSLNLQALPLLLPAALPARGHLGVAFQQGLT